MSLPRFAHPFFCSIYASHASYFRQVEFVTLPRSLLIHTSCPQLDSSTAAISVIARAALLPCILSITLRVKDTEGRPIRNQAINVFESFDEDVISTFSVNSPFLPPGQLFVRGDGSSGSNFFFACAKVLPPQFLQLQTPPVTKLSIPLFIRSMQSLPTLLVVYRAPSHRR